MQPNAAFGAPVTKTLPSKMNDDPISGATHRFDLRPMVGPGTSMGCTFDNMDWMRRGLLSLVGLALVSVAWGARILVPMDDVRPTT